MTPEVETAAAAAPGYRREGTAAPAAAPTRAARRPARATWRGRDLLPLFLVAFALALYLPSFGWGVPHATAYERTHAWGNDDLVPLHPLAEMHNTFIVAKPDRNIAYPWFHYFLLGCAYAPYLGFLALTGGLSVGPVDYPFGLADPVTAFRHLTWIGRTVSVLLAMVTVLGSYHAGRILWGRRAGMFAGLTTTLLFPMVYYAKLGNLEIPVLAWTSLGFAAVALCLRRGATVRRGIWLGAFVALALATKDQALGSFLLVLPALLWLCLRGHLPRAEDDTARRWAAPGAALASCALVYVVASGIPVDPLRYVQHLTKAATAGTVAIYTRHPATLDGLIAHSADLARFLVEVMGWPMLIVAIVGVALAARRDRVSLVLVLGAAGFYLLLLPVRFSRIHYLLPIALPLALFAGYALSEGIARGGRVRAVTVAMAVGGLGLLLLQSVDLTHDMVRDSRYAAGEWLSRHTRAGDRLLYFGAPLKLPPLDAEVEGIRVEEQALALPAITEQRPELIVVIPEDTDEHRTRVQWRTGWRSVVPPAVPDSVFARLADGSLGYRLVAQFQSPRLMPWLPRPFLSYSSVNPPVQILLREDRAAGMERLEPWSTAPYYPRYEAPAGRPVI